jgi:hypothetical protein
MIIIYREPEMSPGIMLDLQGMINFIADVIQNAVKNNKETTFTIIIKKENE